MSTPGLDSPTSPTSPGYTMSPTTPVDGPFASTLNHKHDDLSEESIKALNRHKLTRELSEQVNHPVPLLSHQILTKSQVFSRWKTDTDVTKRFVEEINKITELDKSVSSCCSSAHSRNPSEDLGAAGDDVMDDGPFQNQAKVPSDIECIVTPLLFWSLQLTF